MPIADPDERARRAVLRSLDPLTELVTVFDSDPQDNNPSALQVLVDPDDVFNMTFDRVGIDSELLIGGFVTGLKHQIPGFSAKIQEVFGNLKSGVQIGLVRKRLSSELGLAMAPNAGGGAAKKAGKKASKKNNG
jgi:hypothetical protein